MFFDAFDADDTYDQKSEYNEESTIPCSELARRDARALTLILLYAIDSFDYQVSLESIADNFGKSFRYSIDPECLAFQEAAAIIAQRDMLDDIIKPLLANWPLNRLGVCTRLIMRLALWELINTDIVPSIIMNEAIELAKCYAETDAYKFVNGVLDEWVKRNRGPALE
jgi:transcription antitermination protein NusB